MPDPKTAWTWAIDLKPWIGRFCRIENKDGSVREGRISGVRSTQFVINGKVYETPLAVELNGDSEDQMVFERMQDLRLK